MKEDEGAVSVGRKRYLSFLGLAGGILAALVAAGYYPTRQLGGEEAIAGMAAGCAVSLVASIISSLPVLLLRRLDAARALSLALGIIALRLVVALSLAVALVLSGHFAAAPLLIWLAIAHAGLLVADTRLTLWVVTRGRQLVQGMT